MLHFISYLKLIAAALITNSHFSEIWPVSSLATGGLLGNVIFLAVSGFLLYNIKLNFPKWFLKRFLRVYPVMFLFTLVVSLCGVYSLKSFEDAFKMFVYPTHYIFIVWLILCYCLFYVIAYVDKHVRNFLEISMGVIFVAWMLVFAIFYDKTAYSVDNVYEPFILFLYMESMLLGALIKKHSHKFGQFKIYKPFVTVAGAGLYFVSKILVSKINAFLPIQVISQMAILIALFLIFDLLMSLENKFQKLPILGGVAKHISNITLQIYIVQFVVIAYLKKLVFPLNLVIVVICIIAGASALYYAECFIRKGINYLIAKARKGKTNAKGTN